MAESATGREARRFETARRITRCAQRLADERGLDGFTMDDLADAAGVSRRTLFNYYPSKTDAVLGTHDPDHEAIVRFRAGGPTGVLVEDLGVLVGRILEDKAIERDEAVRLRRLFSNTPRLLVAAHDSMSKLSDLFVEEILQREDGAVDPTEARILFRVVLSIFDTALDDYIVSVDGRSLGEHYAEHYRTLRALFA